MCVVAESGRAGPVARLVPGQLHRDDPSTPAGRPDSELIGLGHRTGADPGCWLRAPVPTPRLSYSLTTAAERPRGPGEAVADRRGRSTPTGRAWRSARGKLTSWRPRLPGGACRRAAGRQIHVSLYGLIAAGAENSEPGRYGGEAPCGDRRFEFDRRVGGGARLLDGGKPPSSRPPLDEERLNTHAVSRPRPLRRGARCGWSRRTWRPTPTSTPWSNDRHRTQTESLGPQSIHIKDADRRCCSRSRRHAWSGTQWRRFARRDGDFRKCCCGPCNG